ncbi:ribosomal protein L7/L12 [Streptomyces actinomycinicus]|uniref:Ribosomal protein L7/L12 n=1 Tax=Streptomyces actinomycinicus TaxID=1695166 RepID=A0A937EJ61_9ACTN|nr:ribosomal protein L7/L12 [Streptomyces actinomycinicus]MBL1083453.1 ribosomal protein L7/L12 [Streptomyces actinomycinicus]
MEEPGFSVLLVEAGDRKTEAVRAIRTVTGLSLFESKLLLDRAPAAVTAPVWFEAAQEAARVLEGAGVDAMVVCDWCDRTVNKGDGPLDPGPCAGPWWPAESCRASRPSAVGDATDAACKDATG